MKISRYRWILLFQATTAMPARGATGPVEKPVANRKACSTSKSRCRSCEQFRERPTHQQLTRSSARIYKHRAEQHAGTEIATIYSTVYSPRVAIGDGLRSI